MKTNPQFTRACIIVSLVFGFAACNYDSELQPPKRVLENNRSQLNSVTGHISDPVTMQKQLNERPE